MIQGGVDARPGVHGPSLVTQHLLESAQQEQDVLPTRGVPHGTDPPHFALQRTEGGTDLDAEVVEERAPHAQVVDAVGNEHGREHRQAALGRLLAEEAQPERGDADAQRVAVQPMAREARRETLLRDRAQRRAQAIDHRRRRRVVVDARGAPVARELAEIQVIAAHRAPAPAERVFGARVVRDRRQTRRAAQALLGPAHRHVHVPGVERDFGAAQGDHDVGDEQGIIRACEAAEIRQRLQDAGGRLTVHDGEHLRGRLGKRGLDRDRVERLAPLRPDDDGVGVAAPREILEQEAETTALADHHAIPRLQQRHHRRLEPRAPAAGDRERARARRLEHQA